jgi:ribosomal protein L11 methyltransferase
LPYRIDVRAAPDSALDRLVELGALDAEFSDDGGVAALMPDGVAPEQVAQALGVVDVSVSAALERDGGSVWVVCRRPILVGRIRLIPADRPSEPDSVRLVDGPAFGTGLHPTTALCLEVLQEVTAPGPPSAVLDVGTGSGVLALAALVLGVPLAFGIDVDEEALRVAAENARMNLVAGRLRLARATPDAVAGAWPLVLANVLAAPLIEMAPTLVRRVGHHGHVVLSGVPSSVEADVVGAYRRLGLRHLRTASRAGWVALLLQASW